jgi:hypothetical protein
MQIVDRIINFIYNNVFQKILLLCETMGKNFVEPDGQQVAIKHSSEEMRFACWVTKARIETHL